MSDERTKDQYVLLAWNAVSKAKELATHAEAAAHHHHPDTPQRVANFAAAGAAWADVARTYTAIAAVLPQDTDEPDTDTDPEV